MVLMGGGCISAKKMRKQSRTQQELSRRGGFRGGQRVKTREAVWSSIFTNIRKTKGGEGPLKSLGGERSG